MAKTRITDEDIQKVLRGSRKDFDEAIQKLRRAFQDGGAFKDVPEEEYGQWQDWAQMNYIPGEKINPVWHPLVRDECERMNQGLILDPELMKKLHGEYPKWYLKQQEGK